MRIHAVVLDGDEYFPGVRLRERAAHGDFAQTDIFDRTLDEDDAEILRDAQTGRAVAGDASGADKHDFTGAARP